MCKMSSLSIFDYCFDFERVEFIHCTQTSETWLSTHHGKKYKITTVTTSLDNALPLCMA